MWNMNNMLLLVFLTLAGSSQGIVNVSVYYEALCPDSTQFIGGQLAPTFYKLKDYMKIDLVPYGKAIHNFVNNQWLFDCQHGPAECTGNKYQSCALAQNNGVEKDLNFINCVMRARNPSNVHIMRNCANRSQIDWNNMMTCATSDKGNELLAANGNKTNNLEVNISFVPTVIINGKYDNYLQKASLKDLLAVVCSKITFLEKPTACDNQFLPNLSTPSYYDWLY